jgi:hypothetical protein
MPVLDDEVHKEMVENSLVIGSGFSFHNMEAFFAPSILETQPKD